MLPPKAKELLCQGVETFLNLGRPNQIWPAIKCLVCGYTSWNRHDIEQRYCGACKAFHADWARWHRLEEAERRPLTSEIIERLFGPGEPG